MCSRSQLLMPWAPTLIHCKMCGHDKAEKEFATYKVGKYGPYRRTTCKRCLVKRNRKWRHCNDEWVRQRNNTYRQKNRERINARKRDVLANDPIKNAERCRQYRATHLDKMKAAARARYLATKTNHEQYTKLREYHRQYRKANWHRILAKKNAEKRAYRETATGHISSTMSNYIYQAIRQDKAGRHWESLVGYTLSDLMFRLEFQFQRGMTWENYGEWHIDHIRPIASFHYTSPQDEEFQQCWSLANLRPLWAKDNIAKGAKWQTKAA